VARELLSFRIQEGIIRAHFLCRANDSKGAKFISAATLAVLKDFEVEQNIECDQEPCINSLVKMGVTLNDIDLVFSPLHSLQFCYTDCWMLATGQNFAKIAT